MAALICIFPFACQLVGKWNGELQNKRLGYNYQRIDGVLWLGGIKFASPLDVKWWKVSGKLVRKWLEKIRSKGGTLIGIWVADWMRRLTNVDSGTEPMASNSIADSLLELSLLKYTASTFGSRVRAQNKLNIFRRRRGNLASLLWILKVTALFCRNEKVAV